MLDDDTLLLEYALGEERSHLWAVTADTVEAFELPARREVEALAREFYQLVVDSHPGGEGEDARQRDERLARARAAYPEVSARLSRMLLGRAAHLLGRRRLLLVKDGALEYIPFGALPDPRDESAGTARPLVVTNEIVSAPSASVLAVQRRELAGRTSAPRSLAVFADPVFTADDPRVAVARAAARKRPAGGQAPKQAAPEDVLSASVSKSLGRLGTMRDGVLSLPRLPFSRAEAEAVLGVAPNGGRATMALGFDANKARAIGGGLAQYRIVHFATHGLIDSESPALSGVVLSLVDERGAQRGGLLGLHEIYGLDLNADLVVLSACRTALGKEIKGEGLDGLARAFMHAGAARVVASLWTVDDAATAELMKHFYRAMLVERLRPAAALRSAQLSMMRQKRWQSPYFWAPFVLQGEWK